MNCKVCGSPITENDQFCKNCGAAVNSIEQNGQSNQQTVGDIQNNNQQPQETGQQVSNNMVNNQLHLMLSNIFFIFISYFYLKREIIASTIYSLACPSP